jgi:5-hydroxyisourate hydrolase
MTKTPRSPITTHVLDVGRGLPAARLDVTLEILDSSGGWQKLGQGTTDADGRVENLLPPGSKARAATYRLTFDTGAYFAGLPAESFYPRVSIVFKLADPDRHHHVPLLLNSYGYSTYRGS